MWSAILKQKGITITFWQFSKVGLLITPVVILIGSATLAFEYAVYPRSLFKRF